MAEQITIEKIEEDPGGAPIVDFDPFASGSSPRLPGILGVPGLTLASDPRLDPRLVEAVGSADAVLDGPAPVGPDSPYAEILDYIGALESEFDAVYVDQFDSLPPVTAVARRSEVIEGKDGNEIRLFIHEPAESAGPATPSDRSVPASSSREA
jgi:hypothetical protein